MALNSINTNIGAYYAQANIGKASAAASSSIARLSSGNKIVQAKDDVAAMAAGTSLRTNVTTLKTALTNTAQGASLLQVADGALSQMTDILQRQKALATQASSGQLSDTDRGFLNQEFTNLTAELDRIVGATNFNGVSLLNGSLGTKSSLANTDAIANVFDTTNSNTAVQSYLKDGALNDDATAIGGMEFVDADGVKLVDSAYNTISPSVVGKVSPAVMSAVSYTDTTVTGSLGVATLSLQINGQTFSGQITDQGTDIILTNGSTRLHLFTDTFDLTDAVSAQTSLAALNTALDGVSIQRVKTVDGVDFSGTALAGTTGDAAVGAPLLRTSSTEANISNFKYVGGASGANIISVEINGQTYTATAVADTIAAGDTINFDGAAGEGLHLDFTGLTTDINDINGSLTDRNSFISALNQAFGKAGTGLSFSVGVEATDKLTVNIKSASTASLYGGQVLSVDTAANAAAASAALDGAINSVTAIRADVGALQSRFDFASSNIQSSIQNQDAARGILLDTDIAAESTAFSQQQVQLQAGIAVLAQANQLPQNLLKLIQ